MGRNVCISAPRAARGLRSVRGTRSPRHRRCEIWVAFADSAPYRSGLRSPHQSDELGGGTVFSTDYTAAAVRQRQHEMHMKAEAHRVARLARMRRRSGTASPGRLAGEHVVLPDGARVVVRPVQSTDQALLADGFGRLSARSRRQRFLTVKRDLSAAELRFLTDIDHHDHEAIGALDARDGRGIGVARYIRSARATRRTPNSPSRSSTTGNDAASARCCCRG